MKKIVLFTCLFIAFQSCKKAENSKEEIAVTEIQLPEAEPVISGEPINQSKTEQNQKIIKNATLRFQSSDLNSTSLKVHQVAKKYQGIIQLDNEAKEYDGTSRNIVLRVPSNHFENAFAEITKGVSYFDEKHITSEDVSAQYIDLEARLKAKKELETRYLYLLKKANKISEILEIEKELTAIREEIEAKQGQLNYMQSQVSMSTIDVKFYKESISSGVTVSYGDKLLNALKGGVSWIPSFVLGLLYIWPLILMVIIGVYYYIRRKKKNKKI